MDVGKRGRHGDEDNASEAHQPAAQFDNLQLYENKIFRVDWTLKGKQCQPTKLAKRLAIYVHFLNLVI